MFYIASIIVLILLINFVIAAGTQVIIGYNLHFNSLYISLIVSTVISMVTAGLVIVDIPK